MPVLPDDDEHALAERILVEEHRIYPEAIAAVLEGRCRVEGRRVVVALAGAVTREP
ncbi:phosphoribosylglycinamide formyltransferase [compost metagenome]